MDHVSQKYKRNMWKLALFIGVATSMVLNIDAIAVADRLWRDSAVRATVIAPAERYAQ
jgi:hypothetical protein